MQQRYNSVPVSKQTTGPTDKYSNLLTLLRFCQHFSVTTFTARNRRNLIKQFIGPYIFPSAPGDTRVPGWTSHWWINIGLCLNKTFLLFYLWPHWPVAEPVKHFVRLALTSDWSGGKQGVHFKVVCALQMSQTLGDSVYLRPCGLFSW